jgi:hypothetical protein
MVALVQRLIAFCRITKAELMRFDGSSGNGSHPTVRRSCIEAPGQAASIYRSVRFRADWDNGGAYHWVIGGFSCCSHRRLPSPRVTTGMCLRIPPSRNLGLIVACAASEPTDGLAASLDHLHAIAKYSSPLRGTVETARMQGTSRT